MFAGSVRPVPPFQYYGACHDWVFDTYELQELSVSRIRSLLVKHANTVLPLSRLELDETLQRLCGAVISKWGNIYFLFTLICFSGFRTMNSFWGIAYNIYRVQLSSAIMDAGYWKLHLIYFGIVILQSTFRPFGLPNSNHCLACLLNESWSFCLSLRQHRALKTLMDTAFCDFSHIFRCLWMHRNNIRFHELPANIYDVQAKVLAVANLHTEWFCFLVTCSTGVSAIPISRCGNFTHY